jgi:hypothetical protein
MKYQVAYTDSRLTFSFNAFLYISTQGPAEFLLKMGGVLTLFAV